MPTSITFTDALGAATLTNQKPFPGDRFGGWEPHTVPIGTAVSRQSDGAISMFVYRTDYGASFELRAIPSLIVAGVSMNQLADRLVAWLMQGGTCSIATGDAESNVYPTCGLRPGSSPACSLSDVQMLEYTLTLDVINLAASPRQMVCRYANQ
jgi:hypothetical protein